MAAFGDVRLRVAAALAGLAPAGDDWPVHDAPVDAVTPPCYLLVWPERPAVWLVPATFCRFVTELQVVCIAARIDPAPGYLELEQLVEAALPALSAAGFGFRPDRAVDGPGPLEIGGLTYQSARIFVSQSVGFVPEQE